MVEVSEMCRWRESVQVCLCVCFFFLFLHCYHQPVSHALLLHHTATLSFDLIPRLSPCTLAILCR